MLREVQTEISTPKHVPDDWMFVIPARDGAPLLQISSRCHSGGFSTSRWKKLVLGSWHSFYSRLNKFWLLFNQFAWICFYAQIICFFVPYIPRIKSLSRTHFSFHYGAVSFSCEPGLTRCHDWYTNHSFAALMLNFSTRILRWAAACALLSRATQRRVLYFKTDDIDTHHH